MGKEDSVHEESFSSGLLEYPQYTRPRDYSGLRVPKVLLSGDHAAISRWRREQALRSTLEHRPSLLSQEGLSEADLAYLRQIDRPCRGRNLYFALLHYPVVTKSGEVGSTSLTNLDIHDIGCVSCSYGLGGCYLVTPLADQRDLAQRLLDYWLKGAGRQTNPDRAQALAHMWIVSGLSAVKEDLHRWTGHLPLVLASSAQRKGDIGFDRVYALLERRPVLVLLGTGFGLAQEVLDQADALLPSLRWLSIYNHLSVRSSAAIYADRILHDGQ
jgi:tRNA (guanine37-N1)-methyltransferase